ncbi:MAG: hypothetical protein DHS20C18_51600 [Saprospiraceae bacterium]|nr:MAG: hypothetical protein DHS20C18_51600 [Saprospiraceae bacterium]
MKKLVLNLVALALVLMGALEVNAQIQTPRPSPTAKISTTVGLTDIDIEYSRPSVKERTIFAADGLVPYGEKWRTGANSATKVSFSDDVKLGGQEVKKGAYAVLTIPTEKEWKVMLYPYESGNWSSYADKEPAVAFSTPTMKSGNMIESFTIDLHNLRDASASLVMAWDKTLVSIPLELNVDDKVMAGIKKTLAGPTGDDYYAAASYYHDSGKDLEQALTWIQKATQVDEPKFWQVRREALILADLKKYEAATKSAKKSMELAEKAKNDDYVRMNKKSIEEWAKMK